MATRTRVGLRSAEELKLLPLPPSVSLLARLISRLACVAVWGLYVILIFVL